MTIGTIADITPNGTATKVSATSIIAHWIQFTATGTSIRVGDANVGSGRGAGLITLVPAFWPRCSFDQGGYDLSTVYVYGGSGSDKVSITYGS